MKPTAKSGTDRSSHPISVAAALTTLANKANEGAQATKGQDVWSSMAVISPRFIDSRLKQFCSR